MKILVSACLLDVYKRQEKNHITIEGLQKPKNDISEGEEEEDY